MALPKDELEVFADVKATPEERARILAGARPFDAEKWRRNTLPPTAEELADLEHFLSELDAIRGASTDATKTS